MSDAEAILAKSLALGFDQSCIVRPDAIETAGQKLATFLKNGWHGDMAWMVENAERRSAPAALWPATKSIIMVAMNYGPEINPLSYEQDPSCGSISVYAQGKDYHHILKKKLKQLGRWITDEFDAQVKVFVDTAPVMEKPLAEASGLGWQGKHTNLVSKEWGSWLFLGSVFTTLDLPAKKAHVDLCGKCRACLDICPTSAFPKPYQLDARRCISYLTIEHKGHINSEFRKAIGNRIYGCDDCLAVCPWNKFAKTAKEAGFHAKKELGAPRLQHLLSLDDAQFRTLFSGSPIKRTGRDRFIRNCLIAAGNSGNPDLVKEIRPLLKDASSLVRAMAVWALRELWEEKEFEVLKNNLAASEPDPDVRAEWKATTS